MSTIIAANASCAQYATHPCPPDLPMTGYVLLPLVGLALVLIAVGLVLRARSRS